MKIVLIFIEVTFKRFNLFIIHLKKIGSYKIVMRFEIIFQIVKFLIIFINKILIKCHINFISFLILFLFNFECYYFMQPLPKFQIIIVLVILSFILIKILGIIIWANFQLNHIHFILFDLMCIY